MGMYAIKDTTLTTIGDAIRNKVNPGLIILQEEFSVDLDKNNGKITISTENQAPLYRYELINGVVDSPHVSNTFYIDDENKNHIYQEPYPNDQPVRTEHFPIVLTTPSPSIIINFSTSYSSVHCLFDVIITPLDKNGNEYKYTPLEMADAINEFSAIPNEAFNISGNCSYRFANGGWDWVLEQYSDKLSFNNISNASYMFSLSKKELGDLELNVKDKTDCSYMCQYATTKKAPKINGNIGHMNNIFYGCSELIEIPYDIYCDNSTYYSMSTMFYGCNKLETLPYIYNAYPSAMDDLFYNCYRLREIPDDYMDTWDFSRIHSYTYGYIDGVFRRCYSLRKVPLKILQKLRNENTTSSSYKFYYGAFEMCYALDELIDLPVDKAKLTSNSFSNFVNKTQRLSNLIFETNEDGTSIIAPWKSQTLDMTNYIGYADNVANILNYNSGITEDKRVIDDATYQALKDDPDYFTLMPEYSRYTHASAVRTIASLPDCSATGTNTIKFKGISGSLTDEGAINTLTDEEIAIASAKGWTVSFT